MTFVEEVVTTRIPPRIYNDRRNKIQDIDSDTYANIVIENRRVAKLAYFNGEWYDITDYVKGASDEIGNIGSINNREHSDICGKYANRFVRDALAGKVKPTDISRFSKTKKTAAAEA